MQKSKIEWCDSTWNPVTGCLNNCEYCYARKIAKRFGGDETGELHIKYLTDIKSLYPWGFDPTFHHERLNDYKNKKGRTIFVCSMADLFGEWVPDKWIGEVFRACAAAPQHRYLFLTKNPKRYIKLEEKGILLKDKNIWYGSTITNQYEYYFYSYEHNTFLSVEPLLEPLCENGNLNTKWIIIGAETGSRKGKVIPKREWIESIVEQCGDNDIPVFMKNSLADIWGEPLIQEYPWSNI